MAKGERNGPTFYYEWQDQIRDIEDKTIQNMLIWAILDYDRYGIKVDLEPYKEQLGYLGYGMCKSLLRDFYSDVDAQVSGWEKRTGRPAKYDLALFIPLFEDGWSNKEIAEKIGCSEKTVSRRKDEWKVIKRRDERMDNEAAAGKIPNKYGF